VESVSIMGKAVLEGGKEILWFRMPISMKEQQIIIFP
jgi:hypothetical protein